MDDSSAMMALAGTGVAVIGAAMALSGMCKQEKKGLSNGLSNGEKKRASKQQKLEMKRERRRLAELERARLLAAAEEAERAAEAAAPEQADGGAKKKKKNKRKHKGKKRKGGVKSFYGDGEGGVDIQAKYAGKVGEDDGVGEWAPVKRSEKRRSKRREQEEEQPAREKRPALPKIHMSLAGCAPAVIGRGGSTIQNIQESSGARLNIDKQLDMLEIVGTQEEIAIARDMVEAVLSKAEERNNGGSGAGRGRAPAAHTSTVEAPADRLGAVIGRGGSNIRQIEAETNCSIDVQRDTNTVVIGGDSFEDVARAEQMVKEAIERSPEGGGGGGGGGGGRDFGPASSTIQLNDHNGCLAVIGRGGSTIQRIEADSGARIRINKDENTAELRGSDEAVGAAEVMIADVLAQSAPGSGAKVTLDSSSIGAVIGRAGSTIRRIENETGARLDIKRSGETATLHISGSADAVASAQAEVDAILAEAAEQAKTRRSRGGRRTAGEGEIEESVAVETDAIGSIIGRGGSTIQQIESESGARLNVDRAAGAVSIIGDPDAVAIAREQVEAIVAKRAQEQEERNNRRSKDSSGPSADSGGWDNGADEDVAGGGGNGW